MCEVLLGQGSDPETHNSYRRNAIDLAKDDEVKTVLMSKATGNRPNIAEAEGAAAAAPAATAEAEAPAAVPKAKAKAKAGAIANAKAKAKGKAKAK